MTTPPGAPMTELFLRSKHIIVTAAWPGFPCHEKRHMVVEGKEIGNFVGCLWWVC